MGGEAGSTVATWLGMVLCLSQSALFSGCNLAFYRLSRLQLEVESRRNVRARRVLNLRKDSNFLLATILWGNVAINVLLALIANSVLVGLYAFFSLPWSSPGSAKSCRRPISRVIH